MSSCQNDKEIKQFTLINNASAFLFDNGKDFEEETLETHMHANFKIPALLIKSLYNNLSKKINGNVINNGAIKNLPNDCCVEIPCDIDQNGIYPQEIGNLPLQLAALISTNVNVQQLTVEASLNHRREHVYHAAMVDPHTASELSLNQIYQMVDELIEDHGEMIPKLI